MRIAIIGKNSYIGNSIAQKLQSCGHTIDFVSSRHNEWLQYDFSQCNAVVHVAAIVHQKQIKDESLYHQVNIDLPYNIAITAKKSGVSHFILMSTMAVFGREKRLKNYHISNSNEDFHPKNLYGQSKLEIENKLRQLECDTFTIAIVRPPSVYGFGCKGNLFNIYKKIAFASCIIPVVATDVKQGMVYIDNLTSAVSEIIALKKRGTFHPQDSGLLSTTEILCQIRMANNKHVYKSRLLGFLIDMLKSTKIYNKLYGAITYDESLVKQNLSTDNYISTSEGVKLMYGSKI